MQGVISFSYTKIVKSGFHPATHKGIALDPVCALLPRGIPPPALIGKRGLCERRKAALCLVLVKKPHKAR
jgi:hypothetical protein